MNGGVRSRVVVPVTAVLYVLAAVMAAKISDSSFAIVLIVIVVVRLSFALVETVGAAIAWQLDGRQQAIDAALVVLRTNGYPDRHFAHDDFSDYLTRIQQGTDDAPQLKSSAREWAKSLAACKAFGPFVGMRMQAVAERALEIHSPRARALTIQSLSKP